MLVNHLKVRPGAETGGFGPQAASTGENSEMAEDKWPKRLRETPNLHCASALPPTPGTPVSLLLFL